MPRCKGIASQDDEGKETSGKKKTQAIAWNKTLKRKITQKELD